MHQFSPLKLSIQHTTTHHPFFTSTHHPKLPWETHIFPDLPRDPFAASRAAFRRELAEPGREAACGASEKRSFGSLDEAPGGFQGDLQPATGNHQVSIRYHQVKDLYITILRVNRSTESLNQQQFFFWAADVKLLTRSQQ